jgi:hypothetical protein
VKPLRALLQRIRDWRRERRIEALTRAVVREFGWGRWDMAREANTLLEAEIGARSTQQIERMERRLQPDLMAARGRLRMIDGGKHGQD